MATLRKRQFEMPQLMQVKVDNWLKTLGAVVDAYGGESITEVDSLLVKVVGDFAGGMVLKKILAWLSTVKRDYIWKSDKEWDAELGLSYDQMRRLRDKVLDPIVTTYQKSARNRTIHYRVNYMALLTSISKVVGVSIFKIKRMFGKAKTAFSGKPRMQPGESQETLTKKLTNSSDKDNIKNVVVNDSDSLVKNHAGLKALLEKGYGKDEVLKYQGLDAEIIQACIDDTDTAEKYNKIQKTYRAYLTGALNIQLKAKAQQAAVTLMLSDVVSDSGDVPAEISEEKIPYQKSKANKAPSWVEAVKAEVDESVNTIVIEDYGGQPLTAKRAWAATYNQLELQLDKISFDSWLRPASLKALDESVFVVTVHNEFARDMLQHRLYRNVRRVLSDVIGRTTELKFELAGVM